MGSLARVPPFSKDTPISLPVEKIAEKRSVGDSPVTRQCIPVIGVCSRNSPLSSAATLISSSIDLM
jgi:hypothetical protein